ncbi:simple sugar transport system ATP-binding protein [Moryella indoligenes]|uniref:Simple sugar transport system ATP-binding protein n=1 Tax=Moryella indoligenes TaxID=371674 RepID=A0AAE4AJ78_9FIRM|nr:sugar ABC transporter ATP-binding protein [Moryella indoligenes]MDQ0151493.1 simple sugar transport system ATP-binding protein [Moryella indoligenes]
MEKIKLETRNISIEFPGVKALDQVNFKVETGEIRAVVGANGAGKSTLMKILAGANPRYTGEISLGGRAVEIRTPVEAKRLGIQIVYQEVDTALYPTLSVAENIIQNDMVMGKTGFFMNWQKTYQEGREALEKLHISREQIDERELVQNLSLAQKQMVLIAKAIRARCNFLILDEPTAPLSSQETEELFRVVRHLHETENVAILFISHRLNEILEICDSYTVMRNGQIIESRNIIEQTTTKEIVEMMLGRSFEENHRREAAHTGEILFELEGFSGADGRIRDISLYARRGEIVGIAGLVGAGKSELCKTIFGAYRRTGGSMKLKGRALNIRNSSDAVKQRIALVPEERRKEGVLVHENVSFNLSAACLSRFCTASFVNRGKVLENARSYIRDLGIATPSERQLVKNLSGGNQQKVAVGKWLAADCDLYIFDEPTKGVDVGAKQDIFHLIQKIAAEGNAVLYATCENAELLSLTDRMYVMYNGQIQAELVSAETSEDEIMYYSVGGKQIKGKERQEMQL